MKKELSILILAGALLFAGTTSAAEAKLPKLVLKVADQDTKKSVVKYEPTFTRLSTNEQKGDSFIFRIAINSDGYNPYITTIDVPWSFRGKNFPVDCFLVSLNSTNVRKTAPVAKRTNINITGIIRNEAGVPLPNVLVRCMDEFQNVIDERITGEDGSYNFSNLPPKKYLLKALSNRDSLGKEFTLTPSATPQVTEPQQTVQTQSNQSAAVTSSTQTSTGILPKLTKESVSITSAENGMLVLHWEKVDPITGILIATKLGGRTTYITPANELFENPTNNAFTVDKIILNNRNLKTNEQPLFRDGIPFDLTFYPVYSASIYSTNSFSMKGIMTRDSVPPAMPVLDSVTSSNRTLIVRWHPAVTGEPLAYKIYTRETNGLRLLEYIENFSTENELQKRITLPQAFRNVTNIFITVTAVDLSRNESDFREKETAINAITQGSNITQDIVLEKGDLPPTEFPKRPVPKVVYRPQPPRPFDINAFIANHYRLPAGKYLKIKNRKLVMPKGSRITLGEKALLSLEGVTIRASTNSSWFGVECQSGSTLEMRGSQLSGAETGIAANKGSRIILDRSLITGCATGISAHSATLLLEGSSLAKNSRAADLSYSTVIIRKQSSVVSNGRNLNAAFCSVTMDGATSAFNRSSLYLLNCPQAAIRNSSILANGGEGLHLDNTPATITGCAVRYNLRNGILCANGSNPVVSASDITENGFCAVRGGGRISNCFISRNNHSDAVDNTPDNGTDDGKLFTFSNMSIQQIYAADSVKGLRQTPSTKQEARP